MDFVPALSTVQHSNRAELNGHCCVTFPNVALILHSRFSFLSAPLARQMDHDLAVEQASALHEAGVQKLIGTDHDVFLDILGRQSRSQIQVKKKRKKVLWIRW